MVARCGRVSDTALGKGIPMKDSIHPKYNTITATCSCGNVMQIPSTLSKDLNLDVCSACHPFYTGKQKSVATGGRVDRFQKRFGALRSAFQKSTHFGAFLCPFPNNLQQPLASIFGA